MLSFVQIEEFLGSYCGDKPEYQVQTPHLSDLVSTNHIICRRRQVLIAKSVEHIAIKENRICFG